MKKDKNQDETAYLLRSPANARHLMLSIAQLQQVSQKQTLIDTKRKAYLRDAQNAWAEYQKTGFHLSIEDADNWLAQLEAGNDADPLEAAK